MNSNPLNDSHTELHIGIPGFSYGDLFLPDRLRDLTDIFYSSLHTNDTALSGRFNHYRTTLGEGMSPEDISQVLVDTAPHLSAFIAELFQVSDEHGRMSRVVGSEMVVFIFKREFVTRRALKRFKGIDGIDRTAIHAAYDALRHGPFADAFSGDDEEKGIATVVVDLLDLEKSLKATPIPEGTLATSIASLAGRIGSAHDTNPALMSLLPTPNVSQAAETIVAPLLDIFEQWTAIEHYSPSDARKGWVSLKTPHTVHYAHLVKLEVPLGMPAGAHMGPIDTIRLRDGFALTDARYNEREVLSEVEYCIYCHNRDKDSCSKGLHEKDGSIKKNPLGVELNGCPLDEKISEMHLLKHQGDGLAGLAVMMIDNPMCPGTGHRICNDCMKGCIYQKQAPVNIPQIETSILTEVLDYPYGFEIYSLLTRWNPLNVKRPYPLANNGKRVLVVGLGPAGYTLAHYLVNEGFGVVGIDGLKIEPLSEDLTGSAERPPLPIHNWRSDLYEDLDDRLLLGFGGVSEYGITVRWDKNFLKVIYIALARRNAFRFYGGVRFGGTVTIEDAWNLGFDHVAIATGAGKPTIVPMKGNLMRGIRQASDFLMALQLTGAYKAEALANLQVRLPALVIGGGLTGIDTATELLAYYPVQVERVLRRYEALAAEQGEEHFWQGFDAEEQGILREFIEHGRAIRSERTAAEAEGRLPDLISLVRSWGGVSLVYRKSMNDAPAYRLNHEEIIKALEEGIYFVENLSPTEAVADDYGAIEAMVFERQRLNDEGKWRATGEMVKMPARSVMVAAGTSPNTIIERENPGSFAYDSWKQFFAPYVESTPSSEHPTVREVLLRAAEKGEVGFFTSYNSNGRLISYYGDNHPHYAGNVVKAMASAKDGYPHVVQLFQEEINQLDPATQNERDSAWQEFGAMLDDQLIATVHEVIRLTPTIVEVIVRAPMAAERFRPGQFYRLQNYEATAPVADGTKLMMEGIALTGAWVDVEQGLLSTIVLEMGTSSRLCAHLKPGERVVLMGPTGTPTEIPTNETVILCGGGLGNAVLFSIGKAMRAAGCRVIYFAGYKKGEDLYHQGDVEESADQVVWSTDTGEHIEPRREQDRYIRANILEAMIAYAKGELGETLVDMKEATRLIAIGSDRMMAAVKNARHGLLQEYLGPHVGIGSINAPMQCMMKEVCAQCLQRHVDPVTGEEKGFVFSCFNQDQNLDEVDFAFLNSRLRANSVLEKLSNRWFDRLLAAEEQKTQTEQIA
jgi:NADPH-dependent glutamate synthase beta subunit-like oxidoreductase/NAD(P)H-flavin reductase